MSKRIVLIEHHAEPHDDRASTQLLELGFELDWRQPFNGENLDTPSFDIAGSVIYGGGQNVDEMSQHPYLQNEIRWIERCLENDVPLLGICLGAQLIAHALGAQVGPHQDGLHEFGYYPIQSTDETEEFLAGELHVMQCHQQGFELPAGTRLLARGHTYPNQAFSYGEQVYGLQFHPECTLATLRRWQTSDWAPWNQPGTQNREQQDNLAARHYDSMCDWFTSFLTSLFQPLATGNRTQIPS